MKSHANRAMARGVEYAAKSSIQITESIIADKGCIGSHSRFCFVGGNNSSDS